MLSYVNTTRFNAVITVRIDTVPDDAEASVEIGSPAAFEKYKGQPNVYYDYYVAAGMQLRIVNNTSATFIAARTIP